MGIFMGYVSFREGNAHQTILFEPTDFEKYSSNRIIARSMTKQQNNFWNDHAVYSINPYETLIKYQPSA